MIYFLDSYDVNVTPDKRMIFLHDESVLVENIKVKLVEFFEEGLEKTSLSSSQSFPLRKPLQNDQIQIISETEIACQENAIIESRKDEDCHQNPPLIVRPVFSSVHSVVSYDLLKQSSLDNQKRSNSMIDSSLSTNNAINPVLEIENEIPDDIIEAQDDFLIEAEHSDNIESHEELNIFQANSEKHSDNIESYEELNSYQEISETVESYFARAEKHLDFGSMKLVSKYQSLVGESLEEIRKLDFEKMRVIGQFNMGFILAFLPSESSDAQGHLLIVDQHAADEKYHYELYQRTTKLSKQPLIVPVVLEMSVSDELLVQDKLEVFAKNGFDISVDPNGPPCRRMKLKSVPYSRNVVFGPDGMYLLIVQMRLNL